MTKFAIAVLAAAALLQPALSVAGDKPATSGPKPNSFVPHPHTHRHVYGAPIQPAIVGPAKTTHHKRVPKKRSAPAAKRDGVNKPELARPDSRATVSHAVKNCPERIFSCNEKRIATQANG
jgi:hypothetical protein